MTRLDPQLRATAVARLTAQRAAGALTSSDVRRTAEGLGVDERSVWRWLAQDGDAQATRRRYYYDGGVCSLLLSVADGLTTAVFSTPEVGWAASRAAEVVSELNRYITIIEQQSGPPSTRVPTLVRRRAMNVTHLWNSWCEQNSPDLVVDVAPIRHRTGQRRTPIMESPAADTQQQ